MKTSTVETHEWVFLALVIVGVFIFNYFIAKKRAGDPESYDSFRQKMLRISASVWPWLMVVIVIKLVLILIIFVKQ